MTVITKNTKHQTATDEKNKTIHAKMRMGTKTKKDLRKYTSKRFHFSVKNVFTFV